MSNSILTRMVLREVTLPFVFSLGAMSLVFLIGKLFTHVEPLLAAGISLKEFLKLNLLMLPIFLYVLIPICSLLGVLIAFLRFSRDSEIVALFSCGIGPSRLLKPLLIIACLALLSSLVVSAVVVPYAKRETGKFMEDITEKALMRGIPEKRFFTPSKGLTFFVDSSSQGGRKFQGVFIRDARSDSFAYDILARNGALSIDMRSGRVVLKLTDGRLFSVSSDYSRVDTVDFKKYLLSITSNPDEGNRKRRGQMTTWELLEASSEPGIRKEKRLKYQVEFHKRIGIPFGAFIMSLLAAPLGVYFGRGGMSQGICVGLASFLTYYLAILFGTTLSEDGNLSPFLGVWIPNILLAIFALLAYRRLFLRGPLKG
ncbi:MAG: LPS export ABC transporter permease LptF [Thermodesulfatator sp.]|nr:MAG: LPS export ABC transporter permease LptF [Thermodesulfatator sp.]